MTPAIKEAKRNRTPVQEDVMAARPVLRSLRIAIVHVLRTKLECVRVEEAFYCMALVITPQWLSRCVIVVRLLVPRIVRLS